jgi:hypothetical protein
MDQAVVDQLHSIAVAQWIMAIAFGLVALVIVGAAVTALIAVKKATGAATDNLNKITGTVEDLSNRLRTGVDAVEDRVRRFGAVVDVVQTEAEELMLDAASTARGVHTAASMIREGRSGDSAVRRSGE